jgi:hypothetical protein
VRPELSGYQPGLRTLRSQSKLKIAHLRVLRRPVAASSRSLAAVAAASPSAPSVRFAVAAAPTPFALTPIAPFAAASAAASAAAPAPADAIAAVVPVASSSSTRPPSDGVAASAADRACVRAAARAPPTPLVHPLPTPAAPNVLLLLAAEALSAPPTRRGSL